MKENRYLLYLLTLAILLFSLFILSTISESGTRDTHGDESDEISYDEGQAEVLEEEKPVSTPENAVKEPKPENSRDADSREEASEPASETLIPDASPEQYFEELLSDYIESISSILDGNQRRTDVIIRYYRHPSDGNKVDQLEDLKFYIHERPVADGLKDYPSNAMFYGDNVSEKDIKLVAYVLVSNGLDLKKIGISKFHDDWKSNSIEIGADSMALNLPSLPLEKIKTFQKVKQ